MPPFDYIEAQSIAEALALLSAPGSSAMGGGTDLLTQVRDGVTPADRLVGLAAIPGMGVISEAPQAWRRRPDHRRRNHHRRRCAPSRRPSALRRAG